MPQSSNVFVLPGIGGSSMLRKDAEREIIREWTALPESERQTEHQAAQFALRMKRKYPFDYIGGDQYQEIRRMIVRLQMVWDNLSCLGTEALAHWS